MATVYKRCKNRYKFLESNNETDGVNIYLGNNVNLVNILYNGRLGDDEYKIKIKDNSFIKDVTFNGETKIGRDTTIEEVILGKNISIGSYVTINRYTVIDDNVIIWRNVEIGSSVHIGKDSLIQDRVIIDRGAFIPDEVEIPAGSRVFYIDEHTIYVNKVINMIYPTADIKDENIIAAKEYLKKWL